MSYINAKEVLPKKLLDEVRSYTGDGLIYIPPKNDARRVWGSKTGTKQMLEERNNEIRRKKSAGITIHTLAEEYNLSVDTIKRVLYR
ncbi:MAG: hypothetical protein J6B90_12540 [Lachnospiraceae bacterium]|nr:hypothetical protein [Lachnospiraceae bacterium]